MPEFKEILRRLCSVMTISGCERNALEEIRESYGGYFDEIDTDMARNVILVKKSKKMTRDIKPKIILDAHLDEVGMIVSGITDEGLLRVTPIGGIDRKILPASEVTVYGKEKLFGVVSALSPHLNRDKSGKAPEWNDVLIDIGYSKEAAEKLVELGTPVGYAYSGDELLNGRITGRGLDDKSCAAALIAAIISTPTEELTCDTYITLSSGEETGRGGVSCAAFTIKPDCALVCDVNFAAQPGLSNGDGASKLESGVMISISAATDRRFTKHIISLAKENKIPHTTTIEPTSTGTNAECIAYVNEGVPAAVIGLPLDGMHSYNEELSLTDAESMIKLVQTLVTNPLY
ncbi:MAG: M42 family metallopeptidase [Eubacteriales bacterium]